MTTTDRLRALADAATPFGDGEIVHLDPDTLRRLIDLAEGLARATAAYLDEVDASRAGAPDPLLRAQREKELRAALAAWDAFQEETPA